MAATGDLDMLTSQLEVQANIVRQLKAEKKEAEGDEVVRIGEQVTAEVAKLLEIKAQIKALKEAAEVRHVRLLGLRGRWECRSGSGGGV